MLRLERDAWSMVKGLRQATNEYAPPPRPGGVLRRRGVTFPIEGWQRYGYRAFGRTLIINSMFHVLPKYATWIRALALA